MKKKILLFLIVLFGFFLRIWNISNIPPGINRDEAAIGYNAFSILKTGRDEYGIFFPLSFKSFGDWKLPLYIYLDVIPISLLSLNELSVRLPSVLFGTGTLIILYFLVSEFFLDEKKSSFSALLATFFLAVSPWHIHFSRVASEANVSLFLTTLSVFLFLKNRENNIFYYLLASVILGLSLYTYHANHIFSPILFLGLTLMLLYQRLSIKKLLFFLTPFLLLCLIIYQQTLFSADRTKFAGLSPLGDQNLVYENIILPRRNHLYPFLARVYHNKLFFLIEKFIQGYLRSFSTEFLFIKGGSNFQHNIPGFGNFYWWDAFVIISGLFFIFHHHYKWRWLLIFWMFISPIPSAITKDAPHSARMLSLLPAPYILSSIGFAKLFFLLKKNCRSAKILFFIVLLFLLFCFSSFLEHYFIHFPKTSASNWGEGYKKLVETVSSLSDDFSEIVMDRPNYSPYIYFLFYQKTDPAIYQTEVIRYPDDREGFAHVKQFKKLYFINFEWSEEFFSSNKLFISWADTTPKSAIDGASFRKIITLDDNQSQFYLFSR